MGRRLSDLVMSLICPVLLRGFGIRAYPDPHRLLARGVMSVGEDRLFLRGELLAEGLLEQDLLDPLPDLLFGHRESIASRPRGRKPLMSDPQRLYSVKGERWFDVGRLLLVIAVVLILALVLGGTGALDDAANIIVQILQVIFNVLVRLIELFVELLKSFG